MEGWDFWGLAGILRHELAFAVNSSASVHRQSTDRQARDNPSWLLNCEDDTLPLWG